MSRWCVCEMMSACDRIWVYVIALEGQRERKINIICISAHVIVLVWVCMWWCVLVCARACERVWVCVYVNLIITCVCVCVYERIGVFPQVVPHCTAHLQPACQPFSVACPEGDRAYVTQEHCSLLPHVMWLLATAPPVVLPNGVSQSVTVKPPTCWSS